MTLQDVLQVHIAQSKLHVIVPINRLFNYFCHYQLLMYCLLTEMHA